MPCRPLWGLVRAFVNLLLYVEYCYIITFNCNYILHLVFQQRKSKDIEALRRKRKRYKDKKKALAKLQQCKNVNIDSTKFQLIDASGSTQDEGCSTADMWNLFTRKSCKDVAICDVFEAYDKKEQQINKEAKRMRLEDLHKEKQKYDLYGEYNDHEPCFPPSDNKHVEIELHTNLCAMDKIALKSKLMEIKSSEERAKELARYYRDRCADFKTKVVQLNSEKLQIKLQSTHKKTKSDNSGEIRS